MNKATISIKPVGNGLYVIQQEAINICKDLEIKKHIPFDETKEFAGVSPRNKILSVPNSTGPANISGYPLKLHPPANWIPIDVSAGVLITTNKPDVIISFTRTEWKPVKAYVSPDVMHSQYKYIEQQIRFNAHDYKTLVFSSISFSDILYFINKYKDAQMVQDPYCLHLLVPYNIRFTPDEWQKLKQYAPSNTSCEYKDTIINSKSSGLLWFTGNNDQEVANSAGIKGTSQYYFEGKLGYHKFEVIDPAKLKPIYPQLEGITDVTIGVFQHNVLMVDLDSAKRNPRLLAKAMPATLTPTLDAIVIGNLNKVSDIGPLLDYPLKLTKLSSGLNQYIVTDAMVQEYFVPIRQASRNYDLTKLRVCHLFINEFKETALVAGNWVERCNLTDNIAIDKAGVKSRKQQLEKKYNKLPAGWTKLSDEEIDTYFTYQQQLQTGQLVLAANASIMPRYYQHKEAFVAWLKLNGHLLVCPLTQEAYIDANITMDQLVTTPGFWTMLTMAFHEDTWLSQLLLSPSLQTLLLAESL